MPHLISILALLLLSALSGCSRLNDHIAALSLDCGDDALDSSSPYVKILDMDGHETLGTSLLARNLESPFEAVQVTSKGCIGLGSGRSTAVAVASKADDGRYGIILNPDELPLFRTMKLQDVSKSLRLASCSPSSFTSGRILPPDWVAQDFAAAYPRTYSLKGRGTAPLELVLAPDRSLQTGPDFEDGPIQLEISYKNLFKEDPEDTQPVLCDLILDRTPPVIQISLNRTLKPDLYKVASGETIVLQAVDQNPDSTFACLQRSGSDTDCTGPENFSEAQPDMKFQAPAAGEWCVIAYAEDKAGLRSPSKHYCFVVYQDAALESIRQLGYSAKLLVDEDELGASHTILQAIKNYRALETNIEKQSIEKELWATAAEVSSQIFERNRIFLKDDLKEMAVLDEEGYLINCSMESLQLWTPSGKMVQKIPFRYQLTPLDRPRVSVKEGTALLFNFNEWLVLRRAGDSLVQVPVHGTRRITQPGAMIWNPVKDEFAVLSASPAEGGLVFEGREGAYHQTAELMNADAVLAAWSDSGNVLAASSEKAVRLFVRNANGQFQDSEVVEENHPTDFPGEGLGIGFIRDEQDGSENLVHMRSNGELRVWNLANRTFNKVRDTVPQDPFTYSNLRGYSILKKSETEAFVKRPDGVSIVSVRDGEFKLKAFSSTATDYGPNFLGQWTWNSRRGILSLVRVRGAHTIGVNFSAAADYRPAFIAQEFEVKAEDIQLLVTLPNDGRSVSYGSSHALRFWAPHAVVGGFQASNLDLPFIRWWLTPGTEPLLVTKDGHGSGDFWSLNGEKKGRLQIGPDTLNDVVDIMGNAQRDRLVTIPGTGDALLWKVDPAQPYRVAEPGATQGPRSLGSIHAAAFLKDERTLVTAGKDSLTIHSDDPQFPVISHPLSFRMPPTEIKVPMGQESGMIWVHASRGSLHEFQFFDTQGKPLGIWKKPAKDMTAVALSPDARFLAVALQKEKLQIYRLGHSGYEQTATIEDSDLSWQAITQDLLWSPDGRFLVAFFRNDKAVIWKNNEGNLSRHGELELHPGPSRDYPCEWWADGTKLIFVDQNELRIMDDAARPLYPSIRPFPLDKTIRALSLAPDGRAVAVSAAGGIRIIDFAEIPDLRTRLCERLKDYFDVSVEFDLSPAFTQYDRNVCQ